MVNTLVFSADHPAATISDRRARGELVRLAPGAFTTDTDADPVHVVRREWPELLGRALPDAVVSDRSARTSAPSDGVLYMVHAGKARNIVLPGLQVRVRSGAPPQAGDIELPGGLHLASRARGLAENCLPSRARGGNARRTLDADELGDWVDYICQNEGADKLAQYRSEAESIAPVLGVGPDQLRALQSAVGIALGTRPDDVTASAALSARRAGRPVDQPRVRRFEVLVEALRDSSPQTRPLADDPGRYKYLPFFEAYFSNFIEGTEFEVDEAARIVFEGEFPANRPADAHDVLGTYRLLSDPEEMRRVGDDVDDFIDMLRRRNAIIMEGRPEIGPGQFKAAANRAGGTYFVSPELVEGTLAAGFRLRSDLDTAWERAVYMAFVVNEVHPFTDGNGRTARAVMSAELTAGHECRIIVPTVFRDDYLDGLRALSRRDDPSIFIKAMRYAHSFTANISFSDYELAKAQLVQANAFEDPDSTDRLKILATTMPSLTSPVDVRSPGRSDLTDRIAPTDPNLDRRDRGRGR